MCGTGKIIIIINMLKKFFRTHPVQQRQYAQRLQQMSSSCSHSYPSSLTFFVTNACNMQCRHCVYSPGLATPGPEELSGTEVKAIMRAIPECEHIIITGGEPFLRTDLLEICAVMQSKKRVLRICTNGTMGDVIITSMRELQKMDFKAINLQVSCEADASEHDALRGSGTFSKTVATLRLLRPLINKKVHVVIASMLTSRTRSYIDACVSLAQEFSMPLLFIPMHTSNKNTWGLNADLINAHQAEAESLVPQPDDIAYVARKTARTACMRDEHKDLLTMALAVVHDRCDADCYAGKIEGVLYANGDVGLCELTVPIGNIRDHDYMFAKLWRSQKAEDMRAMIKGCRCLQGCSLSSRAHHRVSGAVPKTTPASF